MISVVSVRVRLTLVESEYEMRVCWILHWLAFLEMNGIRIRCTDDELVDIGLSVADGSMIVGL